MLCGVSVKVCSDFSPEHIVCVCVYIYKVCVFLRVKITQVAADEINNEDLTPLLLSATRCHSDSALWYTDTNWIYCMSSS